jgi:hypothetical protein
MLLIKGKSFARYFTEQFERTARDRFGLPYRPPENEGDAARRERLRQVRDLVAETTAAVTRQLGEDEARLWFKLAFQKLPEGRPLDEIENAALLSSYDALLERGASPKRAARVAAGEMIVSDEDPESIAKQIRRLVKAREEENARVAEQSASDLLWFQGAQACHGLTDGLIRLTDSDRIARSL